MKAKTGGDDSAPSSLAAYSPPRLACHVVDLPDGVDLIDVAGPSGFLWVHDGVGFASRGIAMRIPYLLGDGGAPGQVTRLLAAIRQDGDGALPVALGALPFSSRQRGELVVPELLVQKTDDGRCVAKITRLRDSPRLTRDDVMRTFRAEQPPRVTAGSFEVSSTFTKTDWIGLVTRALEKIQSGNIRKVVLAREISVKWQGYLSRAAVLRQLRLLSPSCILFACGGFVGSTPELLVSLKGDEVISHPLAGTIANDSGLHARDLLASEKDQHELRLVVEEVAAVLERFCLDLRVPPGPSAFSAGSLTHLGTRLTGVARQPRRSVLELVAALHPTASVGGVPRARALEFIDANEGLQRGLWAGPVGWVDGEGNGQWAVAIRSAETSSASAARLCAGAGIVSGSDPIQEFEETEAKLQGTLEAILRAKQPHP